MAEKPEHLKDEGSRSQVVISGAVAGLVSRFCIAPLDVIKIRLQLQVHLLQDALSESPNRQPLYRGTFGTLATILRQEGITALWKGNIPAELLYISYGVCQFTLYRSTNQFIESFQISSRLPDSAKSFATGAIAGGLSTTATYPLDLLRTRFAAQGTTKVYASLIASVRDITRHEGPRGFFQGLSAAVVQIVPLMGLFFASYETLKIPLAGLDLPIGSGDALSGILASVSSKTAVFPLDTVRKRLQVQGPTRSKYVHGNIPLYKGIAATIKTIVAREGIKGLYRGLPVGLVKAAPASAITMWTYERTMKFLQRAERTTG